MKKILIMILSLVSLSAFSDDNARCLKLQRGIEDQQLSNATHIMIEQAGADIDFVFLQKKNNQELGTVVVALHWLHDQYQQPIGGRSNFITYINTKNNNETKTFKLFLVNGDRVRRLDQVLDLDLVGPLLVSMDETKVYRTSFVPIENCEVLPTP